MATYCFVCSTLHLVPEVVKVCKPWQHLLVTPYSWSHMVEDGDSHTFYLVLVTRSQLEKKLKASRLSRTTIFADCIKTCTKPEMTLTSSGETAAVVNFLPGGMLTWKTSEKLRRG